MKFEELKSKVTHGEIDTVLACLVDMQGRLMGKRFHAVHFVTSAFEETHCCDYLLATDLEMATPDGYRASSWERGYGDYTMVPDLDTIRPIPWLDKTAIVLCDVVDHHTHAEVPHSPRAMLKRQVARLADLGLKAMTATEMEFFLFEQNYDAIRMSGFQQMDPISGYNEDYNILQTSREEHVMQPIRNHLFEAGIPVENSKGEAETGQEELNIRYADALSTAEFHTLAKHAVKEIAQQIGHAASFMAKWKADKVGSSSHVHQSLRADGKNAFYDPKAQLGMSALMKCYVAGQLKYAPDITYFLAPYVNSYKRFMKGTFAPTRAIWSVDNRTAGFRLCGEGSEAVRIECRIGGADLNPYLALSALLAAGIAGIEEDLTLGPPASGDAYQDEGANIPGDLAEARSTLTKSAMLRAAMGDDVVDHYARAAEVELEAYANAVTDWELARGFERA